MKLAQTARDRGGVFLILALTAMMFFSVVINASMMIGLAPTTGIPLPLVSYGGSSIATTFLWPSASSWASSTAGSPTREERAPRQRDSTRDARRAPEDGRVVEVLHERRGNGRGWSATSISAGFTACCPGCRPRSSRSAWSATPSSTSRTSVASRGVRLRRRTGTAARRGAERADRPRIDDLVKEGQEIVVQVTKDAVGGKGPRVTAAISLPGRDARLSAERAGAGCRDASRTSASANDCAGS